MYRFLLRPAWIGAALLAIAAALVQVRLSEWQLHRYEERHAINNRIDAADTTQPVPLTSVMAVPTTAGAAGKSPGNAVAWTKITVTGTYDATHEIQARARTVNGDVGFEILDPLLLSDGTAVLIDRGWVPAPNGGAGAAPAVPAAATGQVTVVGQIHLSESRPTPIEHRDGRLDTRRISVGKLAEQMPYPVYGAYVLLTEQTPANDKAFSQIPIDQEDDWQNAGYTVQWFLFACMTLFAFGWQARKEAQIRAGVISPTGERIEPAPVGASADGSVSVDSGAVGSGLAEADAAGSDAAGSNAAGSGAAGSDAAGSGPAGTGSAGSDDRVGAAARRRAAAPKDRVEAADRKRADRVEAADRKRADRVEAADRKRAAAPKDRVEAADRKRAKASLDRVEEADRKRREAEDARKG